MSAFGHCRSKAAAFPKGGNENGGSRGEGITSSWSRFAFGRRAKDRFSVLHVRRRCFGMDENFFYTHILYDL